MTTMAFNKIQSYSYKTLERVNHLKTSAQSCDGQLTKDQSYTITTNKYL
jgi:hypothetical protein